MNDDPYLPPGCTQAMIDAYCGPREYVCKGCGSRYTDEDEQGCPQCVAMANYEYDTAADQQRAVQK